MEGDAPKMYYVPLSIKMVEQAFANGEKLDGRDIKSAVIVGRVVQREINEKGQCIYIINDNTGYMKVIDYKAEEENNPIHKNYHYVPNGYARVHGVLFRHQLSLELITNIQHANEITNFWLNVATGKCSRTLGTLSEEEQKSAPPSVARPPPTEALTDKEQKVLNAMKEMKEEGLILDRDDIHDRIHTEMDFIEYGIVVDSLLFKNKIKTTTDVQHFALINN